MKKIILGIGSLTATIVPVTVTVACGEKKGGESSTNKVETVKNKWIPQEDIANLDAYKYYIPLLNELYAIGDISENDYAALEMQIWNLGTESKIKIHSAQTPEEIEKVTDWYNKCIQDAVNESFELQFEFELDEWMFPIPRYITGFGKNGDNLYSNSLMKIGNNVSKQFMVAYKNFNKAFKQVAPLLEQKINNNKNQSMTKEATITKIKRYIDLSTNYYYSYYFKNSSANEVDEMHSLLEEFEQIGISGDIKSLTTPIINVEIIAKIAHGLIEQTTKINSSDKNDEVKKLATHTVASYLAHADLTDMEALDDLKNFLKSPISKTTIYLGVGN